jgi:hypothetical protein
MKKILKVIGIFFGIIISLIIAASVAIIIIVDKELVEDQMKSALNRHVTIKSIDVGIFSVLSGIEVKDVKISNFKTPAQLKKLKGKEVSKGDLFMGLDSFVFKVKFLPLLDKKFVLQSLILNKPQINIIRSKKGNLNIDDLLAPSPKKTEPENKKKKAEKKPQKDKPFTADDIPVEISIGEVGMKKGVVTLTDNQTGQRFVIYNFTILVHSIKIDPKNLKEKNQVKVKFDMAIKTMGSVKSGGIKTFDISLYARGNVAPFDLKTKQIDPGVSLKIGSNRGMVTGLQIFESIKNIPVLKKYCGKLDFLKGTQSWKDASLKAWYKGGTIKIQDGKVVTADFTTTFGGSVNYKSKAINLAIDLVLADKHKKYIHSGLVTNSAKLIKGKVAQYVKPKQVADIAIKPLLNKDGKVYMKYQVTGTWSRPKTQLTHPRFESLTVIIQKQAGDAVNVYTKAAEKRVNQEVNKQKKAVETRAKKEAGKYMNNLKNKLP